MSLIKSYPKHHSCQVVIIDRYVKGQAHLVPGLYCADHGKWIKWLSLKDADELVEFGVEHLGSLSAEKAMLDRSKI